MSPCCFFALIPNRKSVRLFLVLLFDLSPQFSPFDQEEQETVRVVALDRSFHIECYRCVDCNLLLSSEEQGRG